MFAWYVGATTYCYHFFHEKSFFFKTLPIFLAFNQIWYKDVPFNVCVKFEGDPIMHFHCHQTISNCVCSTSLVIKQTDSII